MDPLIECLYRVAILHKQSCTRDSLTLGVPLQNGRLQPNLLPQAALNARLHCTLQQQDLLQVNTSLLPVIVILNQNRACLLMKIQGDSAWVIHPEVSQSVMEQPLSTIQADHSGYIAYLKPKFKFEQQQASQSQPSHNWLWDALKPNLGIYRDALLAALLVNLFALTMPLFVMNVYDRVVPNQSFDSLWVLASGMFMVFVLDLAIKATRTWLIDLAAIQTDKLLSARIMQSILGMQLTAKQQSSGSLAANIQQYDFIRNFFSSSVVTLLIDLPFVILFASIIYWIAPVALMPIALAAILVLLASLWTKFRLGSNSQRVAKVSAQRNTHLIEGLVNLEQLKAFNHQGSMQAEWENNSFYLAELNARNKLHTSLLSNISQFAQQLAGVGVIIVGVYLLVDGNLSQGGIIACYLISSRIMSPISQLTGILIQWQQASQAYKNINALVQLPQEQLPQGSKDPSISGKIEIKHGKFQYNDQTCALNDISISVKQGEKIAILGRNGSGKSTLLKLFLGLYQLESGTLTFDGIDARQLDLKHLRRQIGYVPQDPMLFLGTLADNIKINHPLASKAAFEKACVVSQLDELINQHPSGADLNVGERGEKLSGGQRQAVALARALIHNPQIILLDEPTSSMDHSHEEAIKKQLQEYAKDRTLILVTHRTSLLDLVDRIIVIDQGTIVADGPKAQVVEALKHGRIGKAS